MGLIDYSDFKGLNYREKTHKISKIRELVNRLFADTEYKMERLNNINLGIKNIKTRIDVVEEPIPPIPPTLPSYIIVHCYNPEGFEINNIYGFECSASVFDDGIFICYSGDSLNLISIGHHTISATFNGVTLTQEIDIISGETRELVFIFSRVVMPIGTDDGSNFAYFRPTYVLNGSGSVSPLNNMADEPSVLFREYREEDAAVVIGFGAIWGPVIGTGSGSGIINATAINVTNTITINVSGEEIYPGVWVVWGWGHSLWYGYLVRGVPIASGFNSWIYQDLIGNSRYVASGIISEQPQSLQAEVSVYINWQGVGSPEESPGSDTDIQTLTIPGFSILTNLVSVPYKII